MSRVKFTDRQQADLTEMQALADSAEDKRFDAQAGGSFNACRVVRGLQVIAQPCCSPAESAF